MAQIAVLSAADQRIRKRNSGCPVNDCFDTSFSATNLLLDFVETLSPYDVQQLSRSAHRDNVGFINVCITLLKADGFAAIPGNKGGPHIVYMLAQHDAYFPYLKALFKACASTESIAEIDLPLCPTAFMVWVETTGENVLCSEFLEAEHSKFVAAQTECKTDSEYEAPRQRCLQSPLPEPEYVFRGYILRVGSEC